MKIKVKDRIVFETFNHYVLELDLEGFTVEDNELIAEQITKDNLDQVGSAVGRTTRNWILNDYPYVRGYCFRNENGEIVGSCWLMLRGGDEKLYRIRKADVFMFRLEVVESYRGKKYSRKIMNRMIEKAKELGCKKAAYVCSPKNKIVLRLHAGLGARITGRRFFVRILDRNIPYYSL